MPEATREVFTASLVLLCRVLQRLPTRNKPYHRGEAPLLSQAGSTCSGRSLGVKYSMAESSSTMVPLLSTMSCS